MTSLRDHIKKSPHRTRLERWLRRTLPTLEGTVLDIGSRNRRYDHLLQQPPIAIDIVENQHLDIQYGDVLNLPYPEDSVDAVLCLEVLEYVADPARALQEMHRVLKKEGRLVLSVPFMMREHEDKQRYTAGYLQELLKDFRIHEFSVVGGSRTVLLNMLWGKIKSSSSRIWRYAGSALLLPLLLAQRNKVAASAYASGYMVVAIK